MREQIIHTIASTGPASFGLGQVALNLVREQIIQGCHSKIWSMDNADDRSWALATSGLSENQIRCFPRSWPNMLVYSRAMEREGYRDSSERIRVVHQHGIWAGFSRVANTLRSHWAIPVIVTPHGSLQSWALKKSSWKKRFAWAAYERDNLRNASCFHAVSENEVLDIRSFGLSNPIAVIPNGISEQWLESEGKAERFRTQFGLSEDQRILLFLSRVTPKKGLPMLLQAIQSLKGKFSDWTLMIAGADEFGHKAEVLEMVNKLGLKDKVIFTGPLFNYLKRDAFEAAELFVLPSFSEGAPIVILESLAAGVPVIATKASPWKELEDFECGWLTEIDQDALAETLETAITKSRLELKRMGQKGKTLVSERYTWRQSARMTLNLYDWLGGYGDRPNFVC